MLRYMYQGHVHCVTAATPHDRHVSRTAPHTHTHTETQRTDPLPPGDDPLPRVGDHPRASILYFESIPEATLDSRRTQSDEVSSLWSLLGQPFQNQA